MAMRLRMDMLAGSLPDEARDTYASMVAQAGRLQVLLDGMRALAVADAAATELAAHPATPAACDASATVLERIDFWLPAAVARDVTLVDHVPAEPIPLLCADTDLEQIVDVLIDNAIKYAPGSTVTVTVTARWPTGRGRVTVADDGVGVPPGELPRLTERFHRGNHDLSGSGLGLAIAERLVTNNGGRLILETVTPHGLSVAAELPVGERPTSPPVDSAPTGTPANGGRGSGLPGLSRSGGTDTMPTIWLPRSQRRRARRRDDPASATTPGAAS